MHHAGAGTAVIRRVIDEPDYRSRTGETGAKLQAGDSVRPVPVLVHRLTP
ncbi:hypothetical protein [Kutzneria sp. 744]|nr:hypothetical protein [Kutzneria sp. 744]